MNVRINVSMNISMSACMYVFHVITLSTIVHLQNCLEACAAGDGTPADTNPRAKLEGGKPGQSSSLAKACSPKRF